MFYRDESDEMLQIDIYTWISKKLLFKYLFRSCYANLVREQRFGGINKTEY